MDPMPGTPCCEYYGYLPRLIRKSAPVGTAPAPLAVTPLGQHVPGAPAEEKYPGSAAASAVAAPPTYTLSKPITYSLAQLPAKPASSLRLVIISDTHERHREMAVPGGDVLIHCGDIQEGLNFCRSVDSMLTDFAAWFNDPLLHPHPVKLVIAGNHDKAIAAMKAEAVRTRFAPALYLCDESAIIEPVGVRVYGTPRSTSNSRWSPNTAFQGSKSWAPFMFPIPTEEGNGADHSAAGDAALCARLEGTRPEGAVDILLAHQSPDIPRARHTVAEQPICTYVRQVAPRRVFLCGHLHGAHGLHRLPAPLVVTRAYGWRHAGRQPEESDEGLEEIPFTPCINASMMKGPPGRGQLLNASVVDLEL